MAGNVASTNSSKISPKVFNCPHCGGQLTISAMGSTTTVVCQHCQSVLDATHPLPKLIESYTTKETYVPDIPLGTFGVLRGVKWKVIGFMVRMDKASSFTWNEYLLFNPYAGFIWLLQSEGHFSFAKSIHSLPQDAGGNQLTLSGNTYELFNFGRAVVKYVAGEFYWRVKVGDTTKMSDYISPPYMLSSELNAQELNWTVSEYLPAAEVQTAFPAQSNQIGYSIGVGANQVNPFHVERGSLFWTWFASILIMAVAGMYFSTSRPEKVIFSENLQFPIGAKNIKMVSPAFEIPDSSGNVNFKLRAPLQNNWLYAGVELINQETGDSFSFDEGVEYYSGYDSDGVWSEGSHDTDRVISSVPGGRYHLEYELQTDATSPVAAVTVSRHGSMHMNFILAMLLVSLYPLIREIRRRSFEMKRWSNSDFNPYHSYSSGGDDDE